MNYINKKYDDVNQIKKTYINNKPFPHFVFDNFIESNIIEDILTEFPDLQNKNGHIKFENKKEIKLASNGSYHLSPNARSLVSYLNSDIFLKYIQSITNIEETLISDPYLEGGGYHEIKKDGLLEVHVDFNKHFFIDIDRRVNLLLYLNKDWNPQWGGLLEFYDKKNLEKPVKKIIPTFNRCVIFNTTSESYHGHPTPLKCPGGISRKSIALYYYSVGRPSSEKTSSHSTLFRPNLTEQADSYLKKFKQIFQLFIPPIIYKLKNKLFS